MGQLTIFQKMLLFVEVTIGEEEKDIIGHEHGSIHSFNFMSNACCCS
jgi:hypothetical protein